VRSRSTSRISFERIGSLGKIMRRTLRKIAANEYDQLGDTSTLADPTVVDDLVDNRMNR
jgi:acetyl-CoA synthetase